VWKILFAALLLSSASVGAAPQPLPEWLAGAWIMQSGDDWADEFWTPPRGGMMLGSARIGKGSELEMWEATRIGYDEAGQLAFWAMPRGVSASKFTATKVETNEIIFVNAEHDYPQRIRYWLEGEGLKAEISLADGSQPFQFTYVKAK
jgi:hypothetical protein